MDVTKSTNDQSTRFVSKIHIKSVSSKGDMVSESSVDNILVKRNFGNKPNVSINNGEPSQVTSYQTELSYDPSLLNLKDLFTHSGNIHPKKGLGKYPKVVIAIMIPLICMNSYFFMGF